LATEALHARERQKASHLTSSADKERHRAIVVLTAHMNLAFENQKHSVCRSTFFPEDAARLSDDLFAVPRKPEPLFIRETVERSDALERRCNLFDGCWTRGRVESRGSGRHPGILRVA
jgi:hypothetical protein